jgi:hypothetical protein
LTDFENQVLQNGLNACFADLFRAVFKASATFFTLPIGSKIGVNGVAGR